MGRSLLLQRVLNGEKIHWKPPKKFLTSSQGGALFANLFTTSGRHKSPGLTLGQVLRSIWFAIQTQTKSLSK